MSTRGAAVGSRPAGSIPVLTTEQPTSGLIAYGAQTIVTAKKPTDYRGQVAIYAKRRVGPICQPRVVQGEGWSEPIGAWRVLWEKRILRGRTLREQLSLVRLPERQRHPIVVGAILATAWLADAIPVESAWWCDPVQWADSDEDEEHLRLAGWGRNGDDYFFVTDQQPYADFSPGRWALLLEDVTPLEAPVHFKGGPSLARWWVPPTRALPEPVKVDGQPTAV